MTCQEDSTRRTPEFPIQNPVKHGVEGGIISKYPANCLTDSKLQLFVKAALDVLDQGRTTVAGDLGTTKVAFDSVSADAFPSSNHSDDDAPGT